MRLCGPNPCEEHDKSVAEEMVEYADSHLLEDAVEVCLVIGVEFVDHEGRKV